MLFVVEEVESAAFETSNFAALSRLVEVGRAILCMPFTSQLMAARTE
jgi:hypothetical protein